MLRNIVSGILRRIVRGLLSEALDVEDMFQLLQLLSTGREASCLSNALPVLCSDRCCLGPKIRRAIGPGRVRACIGWCVGVVPKFPYTGDKIDFSLSPL